MALKDFKVPAPFGQIEALPHDLQMEYLRHAALMPPSEQRDFGHALDAGLMALRYFGVEAGEEFIGGVACLLANPEHSFSTLPAHQEPLVDPVRDVIMDQHGFRRE